MIVVLFLAPCRVFLEPARGSIFRRLRVCPLQAKLRCCGCYIISKFQYADKFFLRVPLLLLLLLFVVKASLHCFFTENGQIFLLQLALGQAFEAFFWGMAGWLISLHLLSKLRTFHRIYRCRKISLWRPLSVECFHSSSKHSIDKMRSHFRPLRFFGFDCNPSGSNA